MLWILMSVCFKYDHLNLQNPIWLAFSLKHLLQMFISYFLMSPCLAEHTLQALLSFPYFLGWVLQRLLGIDGQQQSNLLFNKHSLQYTHTHSLHNTQSITINQYIQGYFQRHALKKSVHYEYLQPASPLIPNQATPSPTLLFALMAKLPIRKPNLPHLSHILPSFLPLPNKFIFILLLSPILQNNLNSNHNSPGSAMFPQFPPSTRSSLNNPRSLSVPRLPGSLQLTDEVFRNLSSQQILHIIFKDIDTHSKPQQRKPKLKQKPVPEATSRSTTKQLLTGCNCRKSKCLKLYCDCFAVGEYCKEGCNCEGCANNVVHQSERVNAVVSVLQKEPNAFLFKKKQSMKQKDRGCTCRKSFCQKKYCECFAEGVECSKYCKCEGCLNCEGGGGHTEVLRRAESRT